MLNNQSTRCRKRGRTERYYLLLIRVFTGASISYQATSCIIQKALPRGVRVSEERSRWNRSAEAGDSSDNGTPGTAISSLALDQQPTSLSVSSRTQVRGSPSFRWPLRGCSPCSLPTWKELDTLGNDSVLLTRLRKPLKCRLWNTCASCQCSYLIGWRTKSIWRCSTQKKQLPDSKRIYLCMREMQGDGEALTQTLSPHRR